MKPIKQSTIVGLFIVLVAICSAEAVPPPPVNQTIGMVDRAFSSLDEDDCRVCHDSGVPDRHHGLYGLTIPDPSNVLYPDADGNGSPDTGYSCLSCHDQNFTVLRDCTVCHTSTPHHMTASAEAGHCADCHGDIVDRPDDEHYIPSYAPSMVTPYVGRKSADDGGGQPANDYGTLAGGCAYCHDADDPVSPTLRPVKSTLANHTAPWL